MENKMRSCAYFSENIDFDAAEQIKYICEACDPKEITCENCKHCKKYQAK